MSTEPNCPQEKTDIEKKQAREKPFHSPYKSQVSLQFKKEEKKNKGGGQEGRKKEKNPTPTTQLS